MYKDVICDINYLKRTVQKQSFYTWLKLSWNQFKTHYYNLRMLYVISMVTTNQEKINTGSEKGIRMFYYKKKKIN